MLNMINLYIKIVKRVSMALQYLNLLGLISEIKQDPRVLGNVKLRK